MNRKSFLQLSTSAASFLGLSAFAGCAIDQNEVSDAQAKKAEANPFKTNGSAVGFAAAPIEKVKIGIIGMGNRGDVLLQMFEWLIANGHAEIIGLSDLKAEKVAKGVEWLASRQKSVPALYHDSPESWKEMAQRDDIDLLLICTPWQDHAPMALFGMEHGKHIAIEVPMATTLEDCWKLCQMAEEKKRHCIMLENCCYNHEEMLVLNMVEDGVFGDLTHAECAYIHDLRAHLLSDTYYENQWRIKEHANRDGNLYPTHGLGPVSFYLGIGRGDTFDHLVSMSSLEQNLSQAAASVNHSLKQFACGDMNTTLIKTALGKTIKLQFDVHTGRPYSRINLLAGTKAVHQGYPSRLYIDNGHGFHGHRWLEEEAYAEYKEQYGHPIWKKLSTQISQSSLGHGGMDFVMMYRLVRCLNLGLPLDINVYDGAMWSAVSPLSELSVAQNSASQPFPDFTAGTWKTKRPLEVSRLEV